MYLFLKDNVDDIRIKGVLCGRTSRRVEKCLSREGVGNSTPLNDSVLYWKMLWILYSPCF